MITISGEVSFKIIFFSKYVDLDLSDVSDQNCQNFEIHGTQVDSNRELDFEFYE